MDQVDKDKMRQFFNESWDINEKMDAFLARANLTQQDLSRLYATRAFKRLRRRMCGGMAARREIEVQRAAMEAAERLTTYVAGRTGDFNELTRKTYGDVIKLARSQEDREADEHSEAKRAPEAPSEAPADAGMSRNLTKAERIAILEKMLGAARADDRIEGGE